MTLRSFGRALPIHMDMLGLVGYAFEARDMRRPKDKEAQMEAMRGGLRALKKSTGADFGYDVAAWRTFLIDAGDTFGYTHPYGYRAVDRAIAKAILNPTIQEMLSALAEEG